MNSKDPFIVMLLSDKVLYLNLTSLNVGTIIPPTLSSITDDHVLIL